MPQITAIRLQKNKKRANIYLDGRFGFGIDLENLIKLGIKEGREIEDSEIEKIIRVSEDQKIWDRLLRFVAIRPRSEKEVKDWLKKKKVPPLLEEKYLGKLKKLDFVDDLKFASWWIEQRLSFRPKSKKMLEKELRMKGIKQELIAEALSHYRIDEYQQAKAILKKAMSRWRNLPSDKFKIKASGFLLRRGYSWEVVDKILSLQNND